MATRPTITVGSVAVDLTDGLTSGKSYEVQLVTRGTLYLYDGADVPDPLVFDTKRATTEFNGGIFRLDVIAGEATWAWTAPGSTLGLSISDA